MNNEKYKNRSEISISDTWNLESMYPDAESAKRDMSRGIARAEELASMRGHVMDSPQTLLSALIAYTESVRLVERAYAYAHMKRDEDNSDPDRADLFGKASMSLTALTSLISFLEPEILSAEPALIVSYIREEDSLSMYSIMLGRLIRQKEHTLSQEEEFIIASYGDVLRSPGSIFSALNDADMVFGTVKDEQGHDVTLTHASYIRLLESPAHEVRNEAYTRMHEAYRAHNNVLTASYSASVRNDVITARLRKYGSSLEAALSPDEIPVSVYDNLVSAVHTHLL